MLCKNCNGELQPEWKVCPRCGNPVMNEKAEIQRESYQQDDVDGIFVRWLLPKLFIVGILALMAGLKLLYSGLPAMVYEGEWVELIVWALIFGALVIWMQHDVSRYAGNKNIYTFGISKNTFVSAESVVKVASKVFEIIAGSKVFLVAGVYHKCHRINDVDT